MSVKTFGAIVGALLVALLVWFGYRLTHQWENERLGPYEVQRNTLTGQVKIAVGGNYVTPFENDPYADPLAPEDLKRVRIINPAWDKTGLLCARALVAPGKPIKGRMALHIVLLDIKLHKRIRDRSLRVTVDWPAGSLTPFAIRTALTPPDNQNEQTVITPQATLYSGEAPASGSNGNSDGNL